MGLSEGEERTEEIFKIVMTENFSKVRHQIIDIESLENI